MGGKLSNLRLNHPGVLTGQTLNSSITSFPTPVYFHTASGQWEPTPANSKNVIAVATSEGTVQLFGFAEFNTDVVTGGYSYYISSTTSGAVTTTDTNNVKVFEAISNNTIFINIQGSVYNGFGVDGPYQSYALFAGSTGASANTIWKYTFAGSHSTSSSTLSGNKYLLAGGGNFTLGLFVGGYNSGNLDTVDKYNWSSEVISPTTALPVGRGYICGSSTMSMFYTFGGSPTNTRVDKMNLSSLTWLNTNALDVGRYQSSAAGDLNRAIIFAGIGSTASTTKYTYSTDTASAGTAHGSTAQHDSSAFSNNTYAWMTGGTSGAPVGIATVRRYTFADDTVSAANSLSVARYAHSSTTSPTKGIVMHGSHSTGNPTTIEEFTFASGTWANSSAVSAQSTYSAACSADPAHLH